ncbi:MAG: DUF481 domain-containing protein [Thermoanaerobaculia bacterium]
MKSYRIATVAVVVLLAFPLSSMGADEEKPKPLWSGTAELSYVSTSGNTKTQTVGTATGVHYRPGAWDTQLEASFVRSESDGEEKARTLTAMLGAARTIHNRLRGFGEIDYLKNRFAGINQRISEDVGVAYQVVSTDSNDLSINAGIGHTREDRIEGEDQSYANGRGGLKYAWKFSATASLSEDALFTQSFSDSRNWRVENALSLSAKVNSFLSLKVSHILNYVNAPVPGFGRTDTTTAAALVAKF